MTKDAKFQSFAVKGGPAVGRRNTPKLRKRLAAHGVDGLVIPHADEYDNEYLPACNERLAWATGFTGSAGAAIVMKDRAAVFADGRYTIQVRAQVDEAIFEVCDLVSAGPAVWIEAHARAGEKIGYDPRLFSPDAVKALHEAATKAGAGLVALASNPLDEAWDDRPPAPNAPISPHPIEYAGESHAAKLKRLAEGLAEGGVQAAIITSPVSIAWLFNLRGGDVAHTPAPLGAAILRADATATLFVAPGKLTNAARAHLDAGVDVEAEDRFAHALSALGGQRVLIDPSSTSAFVVHTLDAAGARLARGADPCARPRAMKNPVEVEGARRAHARDGVAVTRFLHWLMTEAQDGLCDEITAAVRLEDFRREIADLKDLSFESISGAGPNSALPHYRVTTSSNRKLKRGSLYLIDSGGQYLDGTTDVTRTVPIGRASAEMKERYTLVLKGHIALSTVRFPAGATGTHLDALARVPLWSAGLEYDHGTGHGVGSYLSVHEGPQRIAKALNPHPLEPGMIVSNEPGYYKAGAYGIRIENLQVVTPPAPIDGGERDMLGFETLTLAPLSRALIVKSLLTKAERSWIDAYHARVRDVIGPRLEAAPRAWLEAETAAL